MTDVLKRVVILGISDSSISVLLKNLINITLATEESYQCSSDY